MFLFYIFIVDKLLRFLGGFKCLCEVLYLESFDFRVVICLKFLWFKFLVFIYLKLSLVNS